MSAIRIKLAAALIGAAAIAALVVEHQSQTRLQSDNASLRRELAQLQSENETLSNRVARSRIAAPQLPAPPIQANTSSIVTDAPPLSFYDRYLNAPKLTVE